MCLGASLPWGCMRQAWWWWGPLTNWISFRTGFSGVRLGMRGTNLYRGAPGDEGSPMSSDQEHYTFEGELDTGWLESKHPDYVAVYDHEGTEIYRWPDLPTAVASLTAAAEREASIKQLRAELTIIANECAGSGGEFWMGTAPMHDLPIFAALVKEREALRAADEQ